MDARGQQVCQNCGEFVPLDHLICRNCGGPAAGAPVDGIPATPVVVTPPGSPTPPGAAQSFDPAPALDHEPPVLDFFETKERKEPEEGAPGPGPPPTAAERDGPAATSPSPPAAGRPPPRPDRPPAPPAAPGPRPNSAAPSPRRSPRSFPPTSSPTERCPVPPDRCHRSGPLCRGARCRGPRRRWRTSPFPLTRPRDAGLPPAAARDPDAGAAPEPDAGTALTLGTPAAAVADATRGALGN